METRQIIWSIELTRKCLQGENASLLMVVSVILVFKACRSMACIFGLIHKYNILGTKESTPTRSENFCSHKLDFKVSHDFKREILGISSTSICSKLPKIVQHMLWWVERNMSCKTTMPGEPWNSLHAEIGKPMTCIKNWEKLLFCSRTFLQ